MREILSRQHKTAKQQVVDDLLILSNLIQLSFHYSCCHLWTGSACKNRKQHSWFTIRGLLPAVYRTQPNQITTWKVWLRTSLCANAPFTLIRSSVRLLFLHPFNIVLCFFLWHSDRPMLDSIVLSYFMNYTLWSKNIKRILSL